ncbi:MAG: acyl-CoA thioesterase, partial [Sphingomonas sp.]|nr:acyl-CoA thioesterase [Sphingomonas sp.]
EAEMVELVARVRMAGIDSVLVSVDLIAEDLLTGERREAATARFTMVAVKS